MENVGSVGDGGIPQQADGDHALLEVHGLVFPGDQLGQLLIACGDIPARRDIHEQWRQDQFQAVLVAFVDGVGPGVLDFLEFANLRDRRRR